MVTTIDPAGVKNVSFPWLFFKADDTERVFPEIIEGVNVTLNPYGILTVEITIDDTWKNGTYGVYDVSAMDGLGNVNSIFADESMREPLFEGFTVSGSQ